MLSRLSQQNSPSGKLTKLLTSANRHKLSNISSQPQISGERYVDANAKIFGLSKNATSELINKENLAQSDNI